MSEDLIRYQHRLQKKGDIVVWFMQYAKDPIPKWAVNVEPYVEPEQNYAVEDTEVDFTNERYDDFGA